MGGVWGGYMGNSFGDVRIGSGNLEEALQSPEGQAAKRALDTLQSAHPGIAATDQKPGD